MFLYVRLYLLLIMKQDSNTNSYQGS
jgi:hypothetical protein